MSPAEQIATKLRADAAVAALVGTRIYPEEMPPNTQLPAIVYSEVDSVPQNTFTSVAATVLGNARVQVDCYSKDYSAAHQVADAASDCIDGLSTSDLSGLELSSRDLFDNELQAHRVSRDFSVWCGR